MSDKKVDNIKKDFQSKAPSLDDLMIDYMPLQIPGQDRILRSYTLGGLNCGRDIRFIIDMETLEYMLEVAKQSQTKRTMIPSAGIKLMVRQSNVGHVYETLHIEGGRPIPEVAPEKFSLQIPRADFLQQSVIRKWKG